MLQVLAHAFFFFETGWIILTGYYIPTYKETPANIRNYNQVHKGNPLSFFSAASPAAPIFRRRLGGLKQRAQKKAREDSFPTDEEAPTHGSAARDSAPKLGSTHLSSMKDHRRRPHR